MGRQLLGIRWLAGRATGPGRVRAAARALAVLLIPALPPHGWERAAEAAAALTGSRRGGRGALGPGEDERPPRAEGAAGEAAGGRSLGGHSGGAKTGGERGGRELPK